MSDQIHGHTILNLVREQSLTVDEVKQAISKEYGDSVLFHTCKLNELSLDEMLDFFLSKKKLLIEDGRLSVNSERVCNH